MSQKSNYVTVIQLCRRNPAMTQKSDYVTEIRLCHRHPTASQTPDLAANRKAPFAPWEKEADKHKNQKVHSETGKWKRR